MNTQRLSRKNNRDEILRIFQHLVWNTWTPSGNPDDDLNDDNETLNYWIKKFSEEWGEVNGKLARNQRGDGNFTDAQISEELGDVLFALTAIAQYYGKSLEDLMVVSYNKVEDRRLQGKIAGTGDSR